MNSLVPREHGPQPALDRARLRQYGLPTVGLLFACITVIYWALRIWSGALAFPWFGIVTVTVIGACLGITVAAMTGRGNTRVLTFVTLLFMAAIFCLWVYQQTYTAPAYGTDELAFDQWAAHLWLHGIDPYRVSLAPAFQRYLVPPIYWTYTLTGRAVTSLSYPSLSFLLHAPLLAAGVHMQAAVYVDTAAWVVSMFLVFRLLPPRWAWLSVLIMGSSMLDSFVLGGVTDALFLPFILLAVWRWDRYGDPGESSIARWVGPIALGLAMAVKQTPWFVAPFLLVGVGIEASRHGRSAVRVGLRYVAVAATVFAVVNLPGIIPDPAAWLHGILLPLTSPTIPSGQGFVDVSYLLGVGGGNLHWYTDAGMVAVMLALWLLVAYYPGFKRAWVGFVPLLFFWVTRSFASYLIDLFPALVVAYLTVRRADGAASFSPRTRALITTGLGVVGIGCAIVAVTTPAPLALRVLASQSTGQFSTLDTLQVQVHNRTSHRIRPHFTVNATGEVTTFWLAQGPTIVGPHQTVQYVLRAPNIDSMPSITGQFRVVAFTNAPPSITVSPLVVTGRAVTILQPAAFAHPIPLGSPITLTVQVRNRLGNPIQRAGIPVVLGQTIYAENGILPGETRINGHPEGQSPVQTTTNRQGQATFHIVGVQSLRLPVYFQAYIQPRHGYPYGYSNVDIAYFK